METYTCESFAMQLLWPFLPVDDDLAEHICSNKDANLLSSAFLHGL